MPTIGDTFRFSNKNVDNHLIVIVSHPDASHGEIVIVNFSSWRADKDQSCIVELGVHPFITRKSCVVYSRKAVRLSDYEMCLSSAEIISDKAVSPALLQQIHEGLLLTQFIPNRCLEILEEQNLIPSD